MIQEVDVTVSAVEVYVEEYKNSLIWIFHIGSESVIFAVFAMIRLFWKKQK